MKSLSFEQCLTDACVFRLVEDGAVSIDAVVHVGGNFTAGRERWSVRFCDDFNRLVLFNNLRERTDACVVSLVEDGDGTVSIYAVVHVDDNFTAGRKHWSVRFCDDFDRLVLINNLGERSW